MTATLRTSKLFAEKLNSKLDDLEMPSDFRSRVSLVSKLLHVSPEKVRFWLYGHQLPNEKEMSLLESEFGMDTHFAKESQPRHSPHVH